MVGVHAGIIFFEILNFYNPIIPSYVASDNLETSRLFFHNYLKNYVINFVVDVSLLLLVFILCTNEHEKSKDQNKIMKNL